jgi:hypothetical protein
VKNRYDRATGWDFLPAAAWVLCGIFAIGCGSEDLPESSSLSPSPKNSQENQGETAYNKNRLPLTSIGARPKTTIPTTAESAEKILQEIMRVMQSPLPDSDNTVDLQKRRRSRNEQIIDLAREVLVLTQSDPQKERVFTAAVHYLMNARAELALQGDPTDINKLVKNVEELYYRDPKSRAAADASYLLAVFVSKGAQKYGQQEPRWVAEFATQARLFAMNFPNESARAINLLSSAAWSCELFGLKDEAIGCYQSMQEQFPDSDQTALAVSSLRRLNLNETTLQLAGPTIDGGFVSVEEYRGKVLLIVFWRAGAKQFVGDLETLMGVADRYQRHGFEILGVNLNKDEQAIESFLETYPVGWQQIFHPDRAKRGWQHPIAVYYGVRKVPMYWLISKQGTVHSTHVKIEQLESRVRLLLGATQNIQK